MTLFVLLPQLCSQEDTISNKPRGQTYIMPLTRLDKGSLIWLNLNVNVAFHPQVYASKSFLQLAGKLKIGLL